ncbi:tRNA1(Val) (adenine(37)-N6)-methyltransferase [Flectobacillus major]|uniref:tRNA1(Val) (adenine(37)-N6)-methyltransferase n=1 Tax=Flectobacillus major TaxID=103 RepID=UPI0003FEDAC2|nr:methyltransferase [Flectobacillus major]
MFQFKQFTIHQDQCAMKVSTDACILGAWVDVKASTRILDIGAGTGLLSLMMAQRSDALIDAVEMDEPAFLQAQQNIGSSVFAERISIYHQPIQDFRSDKKYDLIVSNPPFYSNYLKSEKVQKNQAHHTETLTFEELLASVFRLLTTYGKFVVLLPEYEMQLLLKLAQLQGFFVTQQLIVRHRVGAKVLRVISVLSLSDTEIVQEELLIKDTHEQYTDAFRALLQEYYLIF